MSAPARRPFSIKIFLPGGAPDGLRIVTKSNWTGVGVVCPRALFEELKGRAEMDAPGVYVLVGPSEKGDLPQVYIGEGDPVGPRLRSHFAKKDFWTWVVFFTASDSLNKAHVKHMESRLVSYAHEAKRAQVENANAPQLPALSEAETADVEDFLLDVLSIMPVVGLHAFESVSAAEPGRVVLFVRQKGIVGRGHESSQGFVVKEGSQAVTTEVPSIHGYLSDLRRELIEQEVLVPDGKFYRLTQDYLFASPSMASGVLLGRSSNGRNAWKTAEGVTLKQLQEAAASEDGDE